MASVSVESLALEDDLGTREPDVRGVAEEVTPFATDEDVDAQIAAQPFRVVYQSNNFLLPQLRDLIIGGDVVNLRPEYQRRLRWPNLQKSLLIESLLLNIPVPAVFFYESDLARYEVMDGQQRLNAIKEFLNNEFPLRGLTVLSTLNGRRYAKLPPRIKRSLDRASISAIIVLQESHGRLRRAGTERYYELRRFVFERLNTGGRRLNGQEIRNAVYGGTFNNTIIELTRDRLFTTIWGIPPYTTSDPNEYYEEPARQKNTLYRLMIDCQLVLRFFALENDEYIEGSMRSILDRCMERYIGIDGAVSDELATRYRSRLDLANSLFDGRPFVLGDATKGRLRPVAGVYDGVMVAMDRLWPQRKRMMERKTRIQAAYVELVEAKTAVRTLTGAANTASDIKHRLSVIHDTILGQL